MKTKNRYESNVMKLWRASWSHRSGYHAPSQYVEAKTLKDAITLAKEQSRLADFPNFWSCHPVAIRDIKKSRNKKQEDNL